MSQAVEEKPVGAVGSIQDAIKAYGVAGNPLDVPHIEISTWIVNQGLFEIPFESVLRQCDKQVADAIGKINRTDAQGRTVRQYICYRDAWEHGSGKTRQTFLWTDAMSCSADKAHVSIRAMRNAIDKDCRSLAELVASMNENNPNLRDNPIQVSFNFDDAVDESPDPKKPR